MFAPLKTWRRWHRKVNVTQRRHAVASALAASAVTPLVQARGHRVDTLAQIPLVLDNKLEGVEKTKDLVAILKRTGAYNDVAKVVETRRVRSGVGKLRNKRYRIRKGPLIVYANENPNLLRAAKNIPGVEVLNVHRLNLRLLAPGGQLGRFIIWTQDAFQALDTIFGSYRKRGEEKGGYQLQRTVMTTPDLARLINSNEIQSVIRPVRQSVVLHEVQKKNPLRNRKALDRLNPFARVQREAAKKRDAENRKRREENIKAKRGVSKQLTAEQKKTKKVRRQASKKWIKNVVQQLHDAATRDVERDVNLATI
jgi:large subunit ribosomal protein L4e